MYQIELLVKSFWNGDGLITEVAGRKPRKYPRKLSDRILCVQAL